MHKPSFRRGRRKAPPLFCPSRKMLRLASKSWHVTSQDLARRNIAMHIARTTPRHVVRRRRPIESSLALLILLVVSCITLNNL